MEAQGHGRPTPLVNTVKNKTNQQNYNELVNLDTEGKKNSH